MIKFCENILSMPGFSPGSEVDRPSTIRAFGLDQDQVLATFQYGNSDYKLEIVFKTRGDQGKFYFKSDRDMERINENPVEIQNILDRANKNNLKNAADLKKLAGLCRAAYVYNENSCSLEGIIKITEKSSGEVLANDWESNILPGDFLSGKILCGTFKTIIENLEDKDMDEYIEFVLMRIKEEADLLKTNK